MLNSIIEFSVRNKLIVGLFVLGLIILGSYEVTKLPIDAVPDITDNQVQVITMAPSYGAADIERLVTFPIEQSCSNIAGTKEIRSFSRFGLSLVTIVFNDGVDVYWARQQVTERLQQAVAEIPEGIGTPELGPISTGLGEIYQYVVKPKKGYEKKYDAIQLRTIQDWVIRRQLLGVKGVAEVSSFGGKLKQIEVAIDPAKLNALGITIHDVMVALQSNNQNTGGAYIEKGPTVLYIRTEGLIGSIDDIQNIVIPLPASEPPLFIRDVATVGVGHATRYGALTYNDEGEVAGAIVMMLKGANSSQVINDVKAKVAQIKLTLPEGVEIEAFLDRSKMVDNAIHTVEKNLIEGALIVVFILVLFLGNFRAGLIVASVIPLALLFAITMMNVFGVSGNLMSLGALDFGLIVDGAVIIVESVMHYLGLKNLGQSAPISRARMDKLVTTSSKKMMNSAVFGQVIILIVYLPIFSLEGIEGKMFKPMAQTVAFALIGAFILSLTYIPMMSAVFLSRKPKVGINFSDRMMKVLEKYYTMGLKKVLRFQRLTLGFIAVLVVIASFVMTLLGGEFIPELEEGDFAVDTRVLTGSNLNTTIEYTQKAAGLLKSKFPEVEKVVTKIGSGEVPTDPMPMEASDMMVVLKPKAEWTSAKTFAELEEKMSTALKDIPGITAGFQYPVQMRFNELMTGARQDVVCKIFGENLDTLSLYADKIGGLIAKVEGTQNLYIEQLQGIPQLVITYRRDQLARYRLSVDEVNKVVSIALAGQKAGLIFEDEKRFDIVLRMAKEKKQNIQDIKQLLIPLASGMQIPLDQVAEVAMKNDINQIQREDAKRRVVIGFNVDGRDVKSIIKNLKEGVSQHIKLPPGYYLTYGGAFENLEKAQGRLLVAVPIALGLIFVLLYFAFGSIRHGLLIFTAIPLSAIGGILLLFLRDLPFSISAGVGFIALFGVAVLNGIVLVAEFNRLRESGMTSLTRIIMTGTQTRLRPVLMTAFVASFGFLPMALSNGAGAEVQRPLATVVIGGLLLATFLTLFVLPLLYLLVEKRFKMNIKTKANVIVFFLFATFSFTLSAQGKISLAAAMDSTLTQNLSINNEVLKSKMSKTLVKSAYNIPKTLLSTEIGQVNSALFDTRFGLAQSIAFPTVYKKQKQLLEAEFLQSLRTQEIESIALKKQITQVFYDYAFLKSKEKLLLHSDSLMQLFLDKCALRNQLGESNQLELLTAKSQKSQIELQLVDLYKELDNNVLKLKYLMNTNYAWIPDITEKDLLPMVVIDSVAINSHPLYRYRLEQIGVEKAKRDLLQAQKYPDLSLAVNNNSFRGIGPDNISYNGSNRFTSVEVGVGIPIFSGSQNTKLQASRIAEQIAVNEANMVSKSLYQSFTTLVTQYNAAEEVANYYISSGINNSNSITTLATEQFQQGQIDYLDYVNLIHQSISIQNSYLEAVHQKNQIAIELNYLSNQ